MNDLPEVTGSLAPGWYGKIPALGDFAVRRLPPEFTDVWDAWLADSLEASQDALGPAWRAAYLRAPIWRFALAPGIIDERFWFGVLMPSVDKVGRQFPLTIAAPAVLPPVPPFAPLASWYEQMAAAALGCLEPGCSADGLDDALAAVVFPAAARDRPAAAGDAVLRFDTSHGLDRAFADAGVALVLRALHGCSLWWPRFAAEDAPDIATCPGLPDPAAFARLLEGSF
jgi:type VI secretion system protein ImpM